MEFSGDDTLILDKWLKFLGLASRKHGIISVYRPVKELLQSPPSPLQSQSQPKLRISRQGSIKNPLVLDDSSIPDRKNRVVDVQPGFGMNRSNSKHGNEFNEAADRTQSHDEEQKLKFDGDRPVDIPRRLNRSANVSPPNRKNVSRESDSQEVPMMSSNSSPTPLVDTEQLTITPDLCATHATNDELSKQGWEDIPSKPARKACSFRDVSETGTSNVKGEKEAKPTESSQSLISTSILSSDTKLGIDSMNTSFSAPVSPRRQDSSRFREPKFESIPVDAFQYIAPFCFPLYPSEDQLKTSKYMQLIYPERKDEWDLEPDVYSFVLTDEMRAFSYGSCLQCKVVFAPSEGDEDLQKSCSESSQSELDVPRHQKSFPSAYGDYSARQASYLSRHRHHRRRPAQDHFPILDTTKSEPSLSCMENCDGDRHRSECDTYAIFCVSNYSRRRGPETLMPLLYCAFEKAANRVHPSNEDQIRQCFATAVNEIYDVYAKFAEELFGVRVSMNSQASMDDDRSETDDGLSQKASFFSTTWSPIKENPLVVHPRSCNHFFEPHIHDLNIFELLSSFGASAFIRVITAVLLEKRLIFYSWFLRRLGTGIHGFLQTLDPLMWQSIFIPVIPIGLLDVLHAPMPYVTGIHTSFLSRLDPCILDETIQVDLDRGVVTMGPSSGFLTMPARLRKSLESQLNTFTIECICQTEDEREKSLDTMLGVFFRMFTSEYMSSYWPLIMDKEKLMGDDGMVNTPNLQPIPNLPEEDVQFWTAFGETQMKEQWTLRASVQHNVMLKKMAHDRNRAVAAAVEAGRPGRANPVHAKSLRSIRAHMSRIGVFRKETLHFGSQNVSSGPSANLKSLPSADSSTSGLMTFPSTGGSSSSTALSSASGGSSAMLKPTPSTGSLQCAKSSSESLHTQESSASAAAKFGTLSSSIPLSIPDEINLQVPFLKKPSADNLTTIEFAPPTENMANSMIKSLKSRIQKK